MTDLGPELKPEITFIFDLVRQLTAGSIRVPRFQRPFVWRPAQMLDLLDSIRRQYPIGSLLAWETDDDIASLATIGPVRVATSRPGTPAYLLDGHQRLSTLAGALVDMSIPSTDDEDMSRWNIYYNAAEDRFEHLPIGLAPKSEQFPLRRLLDTVQFIEECQRILASDVQHGKDYVARIQILARTFQNYKVPLIRIRETGLTEAVEIFARLNSKGQAMTADQMVSALLYREGVKAFDLSTEIDVTMAELERVGFEDLDRAAVLRTLLAAVGEDIYRTDWTRLATARRDVLQTRLAEALPGVTRGLLQATGFLREECGVTNARLLPYSMQLVVLASFFFSQENPSSEQLRLLRRWFWVSSFGSWFGGTNPSRVNALVREASGALASERANPQLTSMNLESAAQPMSSTFDMRSARTRATLLVLLSLRPRHGSGEVIDRPDELIQLLGPEAVAHIVPSSQGVTLLSSPANRLIRPSRDDRGLARGWLRELDATIAAAVCESHAIPLESLESLVDGNWSGFVTARYWRLVEVERAFMEQVGVLPPVSLSSTPVILDAD